MQCTSPERQSCYQVRAILERTPSLKIKHNTAHNHADDSRKTQLLEAFRGKAFLLVHWRSISSGLSRLCVSPTLGKGDMAELVHGVRVRKVELRCQEPSLCPSKEDCMRSIIYNDSNIQNSLPHRFCLPNPRAVSLSRRHSVLFALYFLYFGLASHVSTTSLGRS